MLYSLSVSILTRPCLLPIWEQGPRAFHGCLSHAYSKPLPPRPTVNEHDIEEHFVKGSGPGGQKINKTNSAVQIKHLPSGMVVKSQATRSRSQNRKIARRLLADRLDYVEKGDESRVAIKVSIKQRKKASKDKKARRKYKALAQEKEDENGAHEKIRGEETPENSEMVSKTE